MSSKGVIKNSIIYTFNNIILKAFNFLLLPLYTTYLTTGDYGITNLVTSFTGVMSYIVVFSLYSAISRFYVDYKENKEEVKKFFGTIITFTIISGIVFTLIFILLKPIVMKYIFEGIKFYPTVLLVLFSMTFACLQTVYQYILQAMQMAKKFALRSIMYFFCSLLLNIMFVVVFKLGANGVILATLLSNIIFTLYMLIDLKAQDLLEICIDHEMLKSILRYSIPLMPHNLSTQLASLISKIFISNSFSLTSVGLFGLASQFGTIADTIQSSVNAAFQPWFYNQMNKERKALKKEVVSLSNTLVWIYGILFLGISLFAQELIMLFMGKNYWKAWTVVPLIVLTFSVKTIYYFYINILLYYKQATKYIFVATLSSSIFNVILSAVLIPKFDMYGSAIADGISMLLRVSIVVWLSKKYKSVGYKIITFIRSFILILIFMGIGLYFSYTMFMFKLNWGNFIYKLVVFSIYIFLALLTQRNKIKSYMKNFRKN